MDKGKEANAVREETILLSEWHSDALQDVLKNTPWVELPFREAVTHLEQERDKFNRSKDGTPWFVAMYLIQSTDEHRFSTLVVKLLGLLFAWETQIKKYGREWFNDRTDKLFAIMRTLPPEQDTALVDLLFSLDPAASKILSLHASNAAKARSLKYYGPGKAAAIADWKACSHEYSSMRAFARNCYKKYGVTDFTTVYNWLREHSRAEA